MRRIRSLLWILTAVLAVPAVIVWLPGEAPLEPPRSGLPAKLGAVHPTGLSLPVSALLAPWVQPVSAAPKTAAASPTPPTAAPDRTALKYVGAVLTGDKKRYFFKVNTGQMLSLIPGEDVKGWLLRSVEDQRFQIHGPGGDYEVVR